MNYTKLIPALKPVAWMLLSVLLLGSLWQQAAAAEVSGLYQASIPVSSRDNERERQQATRAALRKVLLKLTGRMDTLDNPVIASALANAQPLMETFAYRSLPAPNTPAAQTPASLMLEVSFYQSQIQSLLESADIPIWPGNRPDTLLWLVEQDEGGQRTLKNGSGSAVVATLQGMAADMGLPLISPILDLEDQLALRVDALWNFDLEAIRQASSRYQADSVLAIRIVRLFGDQVIARAVYLFRGQMLEVEVLENQLQPFLEASVNMTAAELAANYAIRQSGSNEGSRVSLVVDAVKGVEDYAGLLRYVESLAVVKSVQMLSVHESTVVLELGTGGQLRQLIESIALDRKLQPLAEPLRENQRVSLHYQWQRP